MQSMALAFALRKIQDDKLENVLFVNCDMHFLFEKLHDYKFNTIFLNFSDPWPKKRQNKRRLTYPTMLNEYYKMLKDDGQLIFKTDNDVLFNDSVEYLKESPFKVVSINYDYDGLDPYDAQTEYETKFRGLGTPIKRYIVSKEGK
jgi:tRNA (guanine-N7-)-methyltransferase